MDCYSWIRTSIRSCSDVHFCQASHPERLFIDCCISWFTSFRPNTDFLEKGFCWLSRRFWPILTLWAGPFTAHSEHYRRTHPYDSTNRLFVQHLHTALAVVQNVSCLRPTVSTPSAEGKPVQDICETAKWVWVGIIKLPALNWTKLKHQGCPCLLVDSTTFSALGMACRRLGLS